MVGLSDQLVASRWKRVASSLLDCGVAVGPFMPWHNSRDPFGWLIAELLLRRTTRTAAQKGFGKLLAMYPSWAELYRAPDKDIARKIKALGLASQRSRQIKALAKTVVEKFGCVVPRTREVLMELPGVGQYIADAILLHVYEERVLPIDSNVQRVLRRAFGLPVPKGTRGSDPYRDPLPKTFARNITNRFHGGAVKNIHRGMLYVAWNACRPHPKCTRCPLRNSCTYASETMS